MQRFSASFLGRPALRGTTAAVGALLVGLLLPAVLQAGEFDWMVREFSRETGMKPTHIPFFGLAKFVVAVGHPAGTTELNLAIFENADVDAARFSRITDDAVGSTWKPMVRVRSKSGELTNIYARPSGKEMRVLIATLDHSDATFVEVRVQPEALLQFVDEHKDGHGH
ncbi:MAG: hypothetical protein WBW33_13305 [Bryobacteraceae bacterium]